MHRILLVEDNVDSRAVCGLLPEHARERGPDPLLPDEERQGLDGRGAARLPGIAAGGLG